MLSDLAARPGGCHQDSLRATRMDSQRPGAASWLARSGLRGDGWQACAHAADDPQGLRIHADSCGRPDRGSRGAPQGREASGVIGPLEVRRRQHEPAFPVQFCFSPPQIASRASRRLSSPKSSPNRLFRSPSSPPPRANPAKSKLPARPGKLQRGPGSLRVVPARPPSPSSFLPEAPASFSFAPLQVPIAPVGLPTPTRERPWQISPVRAIQSSMKSPREPAVAKGVRTASWGL